VGSTTAHGSATNVRQEAQLADIQMGSQTRAWHGVIHAHQPNTPHMHAR